ncbi:MAG: response regulator [Bacteroidetes bacterium]|nr:response regulator [Bacteroidota bacterium]
MLVRDSDHCSLSGIRYSKYLLAIVFCIILSIPAFPSVIHISGAGPITNIPTSVVHLLLTISGALIVISLLVTYFSIKLRKLNSELLEKNKNILDENKDLQKRRNELAFQKELIAKEHYESEEFFRMLVQSVNDGISYYDRDGSLKYANPAFYSLTGISRESFTMQEFMANLHPEFNDYLTRRDDGLLKHGFYECEISIRHKDGNYVVLSTRSAVVHSSSNEVLGFITVMRDITVLKKGLDEILKSNIQSEAGNRLKAGFLANISHEIRTPLNSVVGFANLLLDDNLPRETKEDYVDHINFNSEKLLQIIGDIIDLSRLASSQIEITYEEASLSGLVREVVDDARLIIKRNDKPIILNVKNNSGDSNDQVFTDRIWLKRVLNHLMDNAIKFTLDGSIEFIYTIDNDNVLFTVKDTGIGINKENLARIFEEFSQEVDGHHRPFEGLGVGLTLAKEVVERMGGKIDVKSEKGIGSEFTFHIPYRPAGTKSKSYQSTEESMAKAVDWRKKKCLLVDDNKDVLIYLNRILIDTGISILTARSGFEALELIKTFPDIDVVILDMQMPEMNGIEATKEIKKIRTDLPIIAQTAFVFENDTDIILEAGCDACLIKPIRRDHLITVMSSFVKPN